METNKPEKKKKKPTGTGAKFSTEEREKVYAEILHWRLKLQWSKYSIVQKLMSKYDVSNNYGYSMIKQIDKKIVKLYGAAETLDELIKKRIGALEELVEKAIAKDQIRTALTVLQELNKVQGVYEAHNKQLTSESLKDISIQIVKNEADIEKALEKENKKNKK